MTVLHITNWYPNHDQPKEALFIQRQIEALESHVQGQEVIHARVISGMPRIIKYEGFGAEHILLQIPTRRWFLIEIFSSLLVLYILIAKRANRYDVVNFHIAYPNLTYWHMIKGFFKPKAVITEHWSAYHLNFGLVKPPSRIQKIFKQDIPVIAVSKALISDIKAFSNATYPEYIIPNVVESAHFKPNKNITKEPNRFFMVSQWKEPKSPFIVIEAFQKVLTVEPHARLIIGGYGPQWQEIVSVCTEIPEVELLGKMDVEEIAKQMQMASAYIHSSAYETFSVVCAEALQCRCPVIASAVGGIPEFVNEANGILVKQNTSEEFFQALTRFIENLVKVNSIPDFSHDTIGKAYYSSLAQILSRNETDK